MSGEERLPEERCRRVGVSGSLGVRRSKEMTQSNTSPRLLIPEGMMAIEVHQNEEILEEEKMEREKESVLPPVGEEQIEVRTH